MRPSALLIHSGGFTSRQWRKLAEALAPELEVLAPDLLGYGAGEAWREGEPFHFRQDLARLEEMVKGPVHLVGHSYGGFLALQFALARPDLVRSIAVYDPVAFGIVGGVDDDAGKLLATGWTGDAWLQTFVDWWNGRGAWERLPAATRDAFRAVGWKVYQEVLSLAADRTDRATYATISAPSLILGGETTPLLERRVVEALGEALPAARLRIIEGAGHMGPITHAAVVNDLIIEHLRGNP